MLSAIVGCTVRIILKDAIYVSSALGMALALSLMQATKTLHPPGEATPNFCTIGIAFFIPEKFLATSLLIALTKDQH